MALSTIPAEQTSELIFSGRAWQRLRPLLIDRGRFAVGDVRRRVVDGVRELLVDDLTVTAALPSGMARPPLDDWCIVVVDHGAGPPPATLIRQLAPKASQLLAVLVVGGREPRACQAALFDQGRLMPLESLRVSGPGLLRLSRSGEPAELDGHDRRRWSRTIGALGAEVVARLRGSTVTLVGAGRLGSQIAFQLAALGIGKLRLVDGDRLELANLDAMPGVTAGDVGRTKVEALAARLCQFRPDLAISYVARPATDPAAQELLSRRADLLVSAVDNDVARLLTSLIARRTLTVHLDIGTSIQRRAGGLEITADVRLLLPGAGCVACVGGLDDVARRLYEVAAPAGALQPGRRQPWHQQRAGSLITINSIAAGVAVQTYLDLCLSRVTSSVWHRLAWQPGAGIQSHSGPVAAAADCRFCRHF